MKRQVSLEEISDGKLYGLNDMAKADCNGCKGCSACCYGMGTSIVCDPYDIHRMMEGLGKTFEQLLEIGAIELQVVDGIILPNLKMTGEREKCYFLNEEERCSIHPYRPGICRIFPLGRYYKEDGFAYILQIYECKSQNRTKVKIKKWIDTPELKKNEEFLNKWHNLQKALQTLLEGDLQEEIAKKISMHILTEYFMKPYSIGIKDFYDEFDKRYANTMNMFALTR